MSGNSYLMSNGQRIAKKTIDQKVRQAKATKIQQFFDLHGYYFCEDCSRSDRKPIDCSHNLSVDQCQKQGRSELAWDVENITLRCRVCHQKYDKLI